MSTPRPESMSSNCRLESEISNGCFLFRTGCSSSYLLRTGWPSSYSRWSDISITTGRIHLIFCGLGVLVGTPRPESMSSNGRLESEMSHVCYLFRTGCSSSYSAQNWMAIQLSGWPSSSSFWSIRCENDDSGQKIQNLTKVQQISKNTEIFDFSIFSPIWPTLLAGMALPL